MTSIEYLFTKLWNTDKDKLMWHSILDKAIEMHKQEMEISDEDIENVAWEKFTGDSAKLGFIEGCKWYREQLKNKENGNNN
jgi:hypothetical protein